MIFKKIEAEHFKSFEKLSVDLENHGFVKIDGVNNTDEFSQSVGSGKSTIADALSYVLTGETVKGNSSMDDVKNLYTKGVCRVAVSFSHNNIDYQIIRGEKELTVIEGDKDISNHLKSETKQLIADKFPMFTPTFLGATVIIGQNMPNSFTNNKPSARKQILEELTNSSFMIDEIKNMVSEKKVEWQSELGELQTKAAVLNSKLQSSANAINQNRERIAQLKSVESIESDMSKSKCEIAVLQKTLEDMKESKALLDEELKKLEDDSAVANSDVTTALNACSEVQSKVDLAVKEHAEFVLKATEEMLIDKSRLESEQGELRSEISAKESEKKKLDDHIHVLKNKPTHCPTCDHPLSDAHTIDTTALEQESECLVDSISALRTKQRIGLDSIELVSAKIQEFKLANKVSPAMLTLNAELELARKIAADAREGLSRFAEVLTLARNRVREADAALRKKDSEIASLKECISTLESGLKEREVLKSLCEDNIRVATIEVEMLECGVKECKEDIDKKQVKIGILNQVASFASREFRTILLVSIIKRLDAYAKSYCSKMLNTDDILFMDDGNNISISLKGRDFGMLSGGESQIVKMCITLALKRTLEDLVGFSTNIMFFDEVLDSCDVATSQQIVDLVSSLELSSTFFISHHAEVYLPVDRTWVVTKTDRISELTM